LLRRSGELHLSEQRSINIAIGLDEAGINDDRDMQEMRMVLRAHRVPGWMTTTSSTGVSCAWRPRAPRRPLGSHIGTIAAGRPPISC
jgi:cytosine/adenosine deaminase-related metal-dependent hydrolase